MKIVHPALNHDVEQLECATGLVCNAPKRLNIAASVTLPRPGVISDQKTDLQPSQSAEQREIIVFWGRRARIVCTAVAVIRRVTSTVADAGRLPVGDDPALSGSSSAERARVALSGVRPDPPCSARLLLPSWRSGGSSSMACLESARLRPRNLWAPRRGSAAAPRLSLSRRLGACKMTKVVEIS